MKKSFFIACAVFSAVLSEGLLPTMMNPMVRAPWVGYPGPDQLAACDHIGDFNETNDRFTAIGVSEYYGWEPPAYVHGEWYFERGYGGKYPATGTMTCYWYYSPYWGLHHDPPNFVWEGHWVPLYGWVWAHYHDWEYTNYNIPRSSTINGYTGSYFQDPNPPYDQWYISSSVSMTAGYP